MGDLCCTTLLAEEERQLLPWQIIPEFSALIFPANYFETLFHLDGKRFLADLFPVLVSNLALVFVVAFSFFSQHVTECHMQHRGIFLKFLQPEKNYKVTHPRNNQGNYRTLGNFELFEYSEGACLVHE